MTFSNLKFGDTGQKKTLIFYINSFSWPHYIYNDKQKLELQLYNDRLMVTLYNSKNIKNILKEIYLSAWDRQSNSCLEITLLIGNVVALAHQKTPYGRFHSELSFPFPGSLKFHFQLSTLTNNGHSFCQKEVKSFSYPLSIYPWK